MQDYLNSLRVTPLRPLGPQRTIPPIMNTNYGSPSMISQKAEPAIPPIMNTNYGSPSMVSQPAQTDGTDGLQKPLDFLERKTRGNEGVIYGQPIEQQDLMNRPRRQNPLLRNWF